MVLARHHDIWNYVRKIKDPTLGLLVSRIVVEYSEVFYRKRITGISRKTRGISGWEICRLLCEGVDDIYRVSGKTIHNYDLLYTMALIVPVGIGEYLSRTKKTELYEWYDAIEMYRDSTWKMWRKSWLAKVDTYSSELMLDTLEAHKIYWSILHSGEKFNLEDKLSMSVENITFNTIYTLRVKS